MFFQSKAFNRLQSILKPSPVTSGYKIIILILSLLGSVIVLLSTSLDGAAVSPDSVYYISAARNIAEGKGLVSFDGTPFIAWPPLYPAVLAIPDLIFHTDPLASAAMINAIIFGLIIYFTGMLFARYLASSPVYSVLGCCFILLSNILQDLSTKAWSENLFILFIVVFLLYLDKYMREKRLLDLIILTFSAACAYLTRFIGISLIMSGAIILFFSRWEKIGAKFKAAFVFTSLSSVPVIILIIRNYFIDGTPLGHRGHGGVSVMENLKLLGGTIMNWGYFPPKSHPSQYFYLFVFAVLTGMFIKFLTKKASQETRERLSLLIPVAFFTMIYLAFLIYAESSYDMDPISMRLVSPIYIPLTLLFLALIDVLLEPARDKFSPVNVNAILVSCLTFWLLLSPLKGTIKYVYYWMNSGTGGFTGIEWQNSELIRFVRGMRIEPGQKVYTNEDEILYILTGIKCREGINNISPGGGKIPTGNGLPSEELKKDYFIWFAKYPDSCPYSKEELDNSSGLMKMTENSDGAVYSMISPSF